MNIFKSYFKKFIRNKFKFFIPELEVLSEAANEVKYFKSVLKDSNIAANVKLYPPYSILHATIKDYTYVAHHAKISRTRIGKFCSIGPHFISGWGIHPIDGLSTSPMFYSVGMQNGFSMCRENKIEERKEIEIGNDVFIGINVTILDGVKIGDGAVIGAGAVVVKDVPPYAVVGGVPAKIIKYRFEERIISKLLEIKWWNFDNDKLHLVEKYFNNIDEFINLMKDY